MLEKHTAKKMTLRLAFVENAFDRIERGVEVAHEKSGVEKWLVQAAMTLHTSTCIDLYCLPKCIMSTRRISFPAVNHVYCVPIVSRQCKNVMFRSLVDLSQTHSIMET